MVHPRWCRRTFQPAPSSNSPTLANSAAPSSFRSSRWRKFSKVVASVALAPQVDPAEVSECFYIVQGILTSLVSQIEPVGDEVHPQHSLQSNRTTTITALDSGVLSRAELGHGTNASMRDKNSALRVFFRYASNPFTANVICVISDYTKIELLYDNSTRHLFRNLFSVSLNHFSF